ncbi:MAG TPA: hypothetical protein DCS07_10020 [Bdellovibrionales bacterium]|nr:MAG: hypothetical protein A2X97_01115 [Bdellovibrionales bacterium GWA1_52_35]OFZ33188.1 MAG: hypothetical protein A2070_15310 [Bdellovibrionales bacterium GWC1_52_8]HAR42947.1 hypothetical protein [Bdellovibrionales bacterium]HCM41664.1 hypothetical protein [Bdellovibrionales bacterium]
MFTAHLLLPAKLILIGLSISGFTAAAKTPLETAYFKNCKSISQPPGWVTDNNGLSRAQVIAIYNYTLGDFSTLNPALQNNSPLDDCQNIQVQLIDAAIKKIPPYRGVVYRGTSLRHFSAAPNQKVVLKPYTSTSKIREGAEAFIRGRLLIIKTKTGRPISTYSNAPNEAEILLPRNTTLLIKKVSTEEMELFSEKNGRYTEMVQIVTAEEI